MNLEQIQAKLAALKDQQTNQKSTTTDNTNLIWKPEPGKQTIRLLPNAFNPDYPFVELSFYYIFGKTLLAPSTFGRPDPVVEYCNALIDPSVKLPVDQWKALNDVKKKLLPKQRTYVPVLVRGKENEGVKFWGFGQRVYSQLLELANDPEYGSIEDLQKGTDLTIEFTPNDDPMQSKTSILPKRSVSVASDDPAVLEKIKGMPDISKQFKEPTYDELKETLKNYLSGNTTTTKPNTPASQSADDGFDPSKPNYPKGEVAEEKSKVDTSDIEAAFAAAFKS